METLLALPEPKARREEIIPFFKATTRGNLIRRVRPDGTFIGREALLVTGANIDTGLVDSGGVRSVYVRELVERDGKFAIAAENTTFKYDPKLRVVKIGKIDYLKPENREFFAPLEGSRY